MVALGILINLMEKKDPKITKLSKPYKKSADNQEKLKLYLLKKQKETKAV